jgi:hypothetical protein
MPLATLAHARRQCPAAVANGLDVERHGRLQRPEQGQIDLEREHGRMVPL